MYVGYNRQVRWLYKSAQLQNYFQPILVLATGKRGNQYGTDHLGKVALIIHTYTYTFGTNIIIKAGIGKAKKRGKIQ